MMNLNALEKQSLKVVTLTIELLEDTCRTPITEQKFLI